MSQDEMSIFNFLINDSRYEKAEDEVGHHLFININLLLFLEIN